MSESVYDDVLSIEEMKRGERVEMVVDIYESADTVRGHNPDAQTEGTDTKRNVQPHHTGKDTAWIRCYRLTAVCVVLLCVLLLTTVTVLWIKYNILNTENNQLQTSYNNLTIERDQLQTSNKNLTIERDQLQTSNKNLTIERDQLQRDREMCFSSSRYFMSNEKKNWTESREDCKDKGADLVIINSREEQKFIDKLLGHRVAWIGLSDRDREGEWKWVDDTPLCTKFWGRGEPNSAAGDEDCVGTVPSFKWADYKCNNKFMLICEKTIFN